MLVFYVSNFLKKEGQVIGLCKTRELRCVVQADIIKDFDSCRNQAIKESLCVRFSEANGGNVKGHGRSNVVRLALSVLALVRDRQLILPVIDR